MVHIKILLLLYLLFNVLLLTSVKADNVINIAAILDLNTVSGREAKLSLELAVQDANEHFNRTRLHLKIQEYEGSVGIKVLQVFRAEAVAIVVQDIKISKLLAPFAEALHVPILSLSGWNRRGSLSSWSNYVVSALCPHSESDEMKAVAAVLEYFRWKEVIVIYEEDEFWLSGVFILDEALEKETKVSQTVGISSLAGRDEIENMLLQLNESDVRVYVLYTSVDVALNIVSIASELRLIEDPYAWVVTDSIASPVDSFTTSSLQNMQGILGIRSLIPLTPDIVDFQNRLQLLSSDNGMNGVWRPAYSCIHLIAKAMVNLVLDFEDIEGPENNTNLGAPMKVLREGELLLHQIKSFRSKDATNCIGEKYEIINLDGKSYRTLGFWTRDEGLKSPSNETNKLRFVIWPGDSPNIPFGYRKLVIGKVERSDRGFEANFYEYINDTFEAVVKALPYDLPFVYEPFGEGSSTESIYDALVTELANGKKIDAVNGDATVLWNRSLYVDFTQPYTSSTCLVMIVPLRKVRNNTWSFLYPFTTGLWGIAGVYFVFTALAVWIMEHSENEGFRGGIAQQMATSLTLSVSAFVFAQSEDVKSGFGRAIVATWLLTALILNNSYTAHLAAVLTAEKLTPTLTNISSLTSTNVKIGYMGSSFVRNILQYDLNASSDRLVPLDPLDYVKSLMNNEVGAVVDESPYIQLVTGSYPCENIMIVDQGYYPLGGFGCFFRKGSPIAADVSQAVLRVSEQHYLMESNRRKWFGQGSSCSPANEDLESKILSIKPTNLWILIVLTALVHIWQKLQVRTSTSQKLLQHGRCLSMDILFFKIIVFFETL